MLFIYQEPPTPPGFSVHNDVVAERTTERTQGRIPDLRKCECCGRHLRRGSCPECALALVSHEESVVTLNPLATYRQHPMIACVSSVAYELPSPERFPWRVLLALLVSYIICTHRV